MPRTIDSLSPKQDGIEPKPANSNTYRSAKAAPALPVPSETEGNNFQNDKITKKQREKVPQPGRKLKLLLAGIAGVLVLATALTFYFNTGLRNSIFKPKPTAGNFANIGDYSVSDKDYDKLKAAYAAFDKSQETSDTERTNKQAANDLLLIASVKSDLNLPDMCNDAATEAKLQPRYDIAGGREKYYQTIKSLYGWDESVARTSACVEIAKEKYADKLNTYSVFGIYIRWDQQPTKATAEQKQAYEQAAKARLEKDYLPSFQRGASVAELTAKADVNPNQAPGQIDPKFSDFTKPYTRVVSADGINHAENGFKEYAEGESNWKYLDSLKTGESTPVFKSNNGFYVVFRMVNRTEGKYNNYDELIADKINTGKVGASYYLLPELKNNILDVNPNNSDTKIKQQSFLENVVRKIIPRAQAANDVGCFTRNHALPFIIRYYDALTRNEILTAGDAVGAVSTGDVVTPCDDEPPAGNAFGVAIGYSDNRLAINASKPSGAIQLNLSCYTAWNFRFIAPSNYNQLSDSDYQDANRFLVGVERAGGVGLSYAGSSEAGSYRLPGSYYQSANGVSKFGIAVYLTPKPIEPSAKPPIGVFDAVDCNVAEGWTADGDNNTLVTDVHVYIDDGTPNEAGFNYGVTNIDRPDVNVGHGGGSAKHGFRFSIPSKYKDNAVHTINVYAIDTQPPLGGNSHLGEKTFQCPPPTYTVRGTKYGPNPAGFGTPFTGANISLDRVLNTTANPYVYANIIGNQNHLIYGDSVADWNLRGYSYNGAGITATNVANFPADTQANGANQTLDWYYAPMPSTLKAGIVMKNGSSLQNPCAAPNNTAGKNLCGNTVVGVQRTSTDAPPAGTGYTTGKVTVTPDATANPKDVGNLYAGNHNVSVDTIMPLWKVVGYRECPYETVNCYTTNAYTSDVATTHSTSIAVNRARPYYYVVEPAPATSSIDVTCSAVTGAVIVPPGVNNVKTKLKLGNDILPDEQGASFVFSNLEKYRDGQSRAVKIVVTYDDINGGAGRGTSEIDTGRNYVCTNSSVCAGNTINDATGGGFVSSSTTTDGTSGTTYTIKVTMKNDGDSLWKDWSTERGYNAGHRLVLDTASQGYWTVATGDMYVKPLTANPPVAGVGYPTVKAPQPDLYQFTFTAQLRNDVVINTNDIPLKFRMAWQTYGNNPQPADMFGPSCGETVHPQLGYRPWLRVQNGSIATLEKALDQPAGTRGGRKVLNGTGYAELNLDVEFAITSAIDTVTQDNRFCSTNAYNYGRDFNPTWSCSFAGYSFKVGDKTKEAYINETDDSIYKQAVEMTGYKDCSNTTYNPSRQNLRTYSTAGDPIPEETFSQPTQNVSLLVSGKNRCGIVTPKTTGNLGPASLAAAPTTATISGGRATWIYNGDLTINSNIINGTGWSVADATDITNLNAIPNLGLIVNGNVTIGPNVSEIDATIYATGRISTCSTYPSETCNKSLKVKGSLAAKGGFALGRNYFDRDAIAARLNIAATNPAFDLQASIGDQNKYYGGPAEDIIGNGISLLLPPPGLEDYSANFYRPKYLPTDLSPRF